MGTLEGGVAGSEEIARVCFETPSPFSRSYRFVVGRGFYRRMYADMEAAVERGEEVGAFMEEVVKRREEFGLTREVGA